MDYDSLEISNRLMGPLFYFMFNIFVVLVTVNVFIAILSESWEAIRAEEQKYNLKDFLVTLVKGQTEKPVDFDEFFEAMLRVDPSISRARARKIFKVMDADGSGTIDCNEMKKVREILGDADPDVQHHESHIKDIKNFLEPQDMQVHHFREDMTTRLGEFDDQMKTLLKQVNEEAEMLQKHAKASSQKDDKQNLQQFQTRIQGQLKESDSKIDKMGEMFEKQFAGLQEMLLKVRDSRSKLG